MLIKIKNLMLFLLLFYSCSSNNSVPDQSILLHIPTDFNIKYFNNHFEIENIIPIETTDSSLISEVKKVITYKGKLILLSGKENMILVINLQTGKILSLINKRGRGPGESNQIIDITFDELLEHIIVYNDYQKLLFFDLQGKFLYEENVGAMYENITNDEGKIIFYNKIEGYTYYPYMFKTYNLRDKSWNEKGNKIKINFPIRILGQLMVKSKRIWFSAPLDFKMSTWENDKITVPYKLDIPTSLLDENLIKKSISNPAEFFQEIMKNNITYSINSIQETENYLFFRSNQQGFFIVNKKNNEVLRSGMPNNNFSIIALMNYYPHEGDDNKIMFTLSAENMVEYSSQILPEISLDIKNKINLSKIQKDDNLILFFYKEKLVTK